MRSYHGTLLALVPLLMALTVSAASAQEGPSLRVDPAAQTVGLAGGAFDVRVLVDDVTNPQGLGGYTLVVNYDPLVLRALSIADSGYVASEENAAFCLASGVDNEAGRAAVLCLSIPLFGAAGPRTTEPRLLATVRFEPISLGSTSVDISQSTLTDPVGNGLLATISSGEVTVAAGTLAPPPEQPSVGGAIAPATGVGPRGGANGIALYAALALAALGLGLLGAGGVIHRRWQIEADPRERSTRG